VNDFLLHPQLLADTHPVCELDLCSVRLTDDMRWPWLVLIPRRAFMRELVDLENDDQLKLLEEINRAARTLQRLYHTDKLNVAALGNVVPQLHIHVISRRRNDDAWPRPVWGVGEAEPYPPKQLAQRLAELSAALPG
jgi:diadenosine tetraphosphate (Ap4A) HIT family hydrolase